MALLSLATIVPVRVLLYASLHHLQLLLMITLITSLTVHHYQLMLLNQLILIINIIGTVIICQSAMVAITLLSCMQSHLL
jgi:hypothetical protein